MRADIHIGPVQVDPDCGFGIVLEAEGERVIAGMRVVSLSQEHGVLRASDSAGRVLPEVGERLRIVPNHSCLAAAMHERYHVLRGTEVVDVWRPVRGW